MDTHVTTDDLAHLILAAILEETPARPAVTLLRMGQTAKAEGYDTEAEYLDSQRRSTHMRLHNSDRHSHLRWMPPKAGVAAILEGYAARFGDASAKRQRARANAARFWYGVPRIILG